MERRYTTLVRTLCVTIALLVGASSGIAGEKKKGDAAKKPLRTTDDVVSGDLTTLATQLALKPGTAVALTAGSYENCFRAGGQAGRVLTHGTTHPVQTPGDGIRFINTQVLAPSPGVIIGDGDLQFNVWITCGTFGEIPNDTPSEQTVMVTLTDLCPGDDSFLTCLDAAGMPVEGRNTFVTVPDGLVERIVCDLEPGGGVGVECRGDVKDGREGCHIKSQIMIRLPPR